MTDLKESVTDLRNKQVPSSPSPSQTEKHEPEEESASMLGVIWETIKYALIAAVIILPIRTFIAQPFVVSGNSMYPTFHNGEYLIVNELAKYQGTYERGDVVILRYPNDPPKYFIKRVIGLPGESVEVRSCEVFIDGRRLQEPYLNPEQTAAVEPSSRCGNHTDIAPLTVPEDMVFVMGDNRVQSFDSRDFGPIDIDEIRGRAFVVIWPASAWAWL